MQLTTLSTMRKKKKVTTILGVVADVIEPYIRLAVITVVGMTGLGSAKANLDAPTNTASYTTPERGKEKTKVQAQTIIPELSPQELKELNSGSVVIKSIDHPGYIWPEVKVYKTIKSSPEKVITTFLDYEKAPNFIPNLKEATVVREHDANTKDVRYTVKLPVLFTIKYIVQNRYEKTDAGHCVSWKLVRSAVAKSVKGNLRVEPHAGGSILCYANLIEPSTRLVAKLKGQAVIEASNTVNAITKEVETNR